MVSRSRETVIMCEKHWSRQKKMKGGTGFKEVNYTLKVG